MVIQKNFPFYQFEFFIQVFPVSPFIVITEPFHLLFPFDFFSNAKSYGIMVRNAEIFQIASRCCEQYVKGVTFCMSSSIYALDEA